MLFCVFRSKTLIWWIGSHAVFVFLISAAGDSCYYTIYIQWRMMVITSVKFKKKHSFNSFEKSLLKISTSAVLKSHSPSWHDIWCNMTLFLKFPRGQDYQWIMSSISVCSSCTRSLILLISAHTYSSPRSTLSPSSFWALELYTVYAVKDMAVILTGVKSELRLLYILRSCVFLIKRDGGHMILSCEEEREDNIFHE